MFGNEVVVQIRKENMIEDVIREHKVKLKGKSACCPFHQESNPSFHVYPKTNSFYCFGCGKGGDVITFIMMIEDVTFVEAIKILAERRGITVPDLTEGDKVEMEKQKRNERILSETMKFYQEQLLSALEFAKRKEVAQ